MRHRVDELRYSAAIVLIFFTYWLTKQTMNCGCCFFAFFFICGGISPITFWVVQVTTMRQPICHQSNKNVSKCITPIQFSMDCYKTVADSIFLRFNCFNRYNSRHQSTARRWTKCHFWPPSIPKKIDVMYIHVFFKGFLNDVPVP